MAGRAIIMEKLISLHGLEILVQYKLVKNITLRVCADNRIKLSVPYIITDRELHSFLAEKETWLRSKLELCRQRPEKRYLMGEVPFDGEHIWLWGEKNCLLLRGGEEGENKFPPDTELPALHRAARADQAAEAGAGRVLVYVSGARGWQQAARQLAEENRRALYRTPCAYDENTLGLLQRVLRPHQPQCAAGLLAARMLGVYRRA